MHNVAVENLEPNMITAERVLSKKGQLIVDKNVLLSIQMIAHIHFYGIEQIKVLDNEFSPDALNAAYRQQSAHETYSERIRKSPEFKEFKYNYEKKVLLIENTMNDVITKNTSVDQQSLLDETMDLW